MFFYNAAEFCESAKNRKKHTSCAQKGRIRYAFLNLNVKTSMGYFYSSRSYNIRKH